MDVKLTIRRWHNRGAVAHAYHMNGDEANMMLPETAERLVLTVVPRHDADAFEPPASLAITLPRGVLRRMLDELDAVEAEPNP